MRACHPGPPHAMVSEGRQIKMGCVENLSMNSWQHIMYLKFKWLIWILVNIWITLSKYIHVGRTCQRTANCICKNILLGSILLKYLRFSLSGWFIFW